MKALDLHPSPATTGDAADQPAPWAGRILQAADDLILREIARPGVGAVVWQRRRDPGFAEWIDALPVDRLPYLRSLVAIEHVESCVHIACDQSGMPADAMRDRLASDAAALAYMFAEIMQSPVLRLRLEPVTSDACRKFHVDHVRARLLCTYRGPGTQLAIGREDGDARLAGALAPGSATILRGLRWPSREKTNVLHRSPPLADSGETRLLLVLDPAEAGHAHC